MEEEGRALSYVHSQEPRFWTVPVAVMDLPLSLAAVQGSHGQVEDITLAEVVPWHKMKSLGHPPGDRVQLRAKSLHKSFLIFIIEMAQAIVKSGHKASFKEETRNNAEDDNLTIQKEETILNSEDFEASNNILKAETVKHFKYFSGEQNLVVKERKSDDCTLGQDIELDINDKINDHIKITIGTEERSVQSKLNTSKFICEECGKNFNLKKTLNKHIQDYHLMYICDQCDFTCKGQANQMKSHKSLKHQALLFACVFCDFISESSREIDLHKENSHEGSSLQTKKSMERKRKEREALKTFTCPICHTSKKSRQSLRIHIKGDHEGISLDCPEEGCSFTGKQSSVIKCHVKSVHLNVKHICDLCGFSASSATRLRLHRIKSHNIRMFACDKCLFRCQKRDRLKYHMQAMHD